jgi:hypothetical protein
MRVAAALAVDPNSRLAALALSLGVSVPSRYDDWISLAVMDPSVYPGCGREMDTRDQR